MVLSDMIKKIAQYSNIHQSRIEYFRQFSMDEQSVFAL